MMQTMFEKLQLHEAKNLLIQGLPSSIEKQFTKVSFAKNVTPLLRTRKIDFALVFAVNQNQLTSIMQDVIPALHEDAKLWIAYPKAASKIVSDLNRECSWTCICNRGYESIHETALDHVWTAIRFQRQGIPIRDTSTEELMAQYSDVPETIPGINLRKQPSRYNKVATRL